MSKNATSSKTPRLSNKQAAKWVHGLWRANADAMYHRRDMKLRIIAVAGVLAMLIGLWIGREQGLAWVQIASLVAGVSVFGASLFTASKNYKADYKRFVLQHLADDGTFLFCPACSKPLGDSQDDAVKADPPATCPACDAKPWKFERPQ